MDITFLWWHWLILGLVLAGFELMTPGGFYILFFGLGAAIVGLLALAGLGGPLWLQILLFAMLSVGLLGVFRSRLLRWLQFDPQRPEVDSLVGEIAVAYEDVLPGGIGKVELRGSTWSARNNTATPVRRGTRCRVIRVDDLMLTIEPEGTR